MSILEQLASAHNRRDEDLNQQLAQTLVSRTDEAVQEDIQELVDNLKSKNANIRHNCIKVLYEVGYIKPALIDIYVSEFVSILSHKDNRMVWGGMTTLGSITSNKPHEVWSHVDTIIKTTANGSVITQDWGIRVLATLSATKQDYSDYVYPFMLEFLSQCKPKDVPRHAESILIGTSTTEKKEALKQVLEKHIPDLNPSQTKRVLKVLKQL